MKLILPFFIATCLFIQGYAQTGIAVPEMSNCDNLVSSFLSQYDIPGATFALAKDGKLVYMRGFGEADLAETEPTQPYHLFRIASVSKPITSIAIMKMVESGQLALSDKVFGPTGIFANNSYFNGVTVTDNRLYDITVNHLLEHSGGWNRDANCITGFATPYSYNPGHCDPIGFPLHVTSVLGEANPVSEQALIRFLMEKGLDFDPGTSYAYSNIGYLTLGLIIEEISGMSYEAYVKSTVLAPLGIYDMHIGKNLLADKHEREGEYHGNGYTSLSIFGDGTAVPWEYGGWNLEAMDAHGGWIGTARDLVRLLVAIDGFSTKPDILSAASINTMVSPSAMNQYYAKGWSVNSFNNWWHTGGLDGTASIWVRTGSGYTWAIILNKRIINAQANGFWTGLDGLPWNCISQTATWPSHDLMDFPSQNSSDLIFSGDDANTLTVAWTSGNGANRVLIAREGTAVDQFPLDGEEYAADAAFSMGADLGNGNYVVYNGNGNSVTLTGLDAAKTYHFRLFDYNQHTGTGNHALYQLANSAQDSATTSTTTGIANLTRQGIRFYPNPAQDRVHIELDMPCDQILLRNMHGQVVQKIEVQGTEVELSIGNLPTQVYLLSFFHHNIHLGSARLMKQ